MLLNDVDFVPTGGINPDCIGPFVEARAVAFGVGSALIAGADQPRDDIKKRARRLVAALREARAAQP